MVAPPEMLSNPGGEAKVRLSGGKLSGRPWSLTSHVFVARGIVIVNRLAIGTWAFLLVPTMLGSLMSISIELSFVFEKTSRWSRTVEGNPKLWRRPLNA